MDDYLRGQFEDLLRAYNFDKEAIKASLQMLTKIVEKQAEQIKELEAEVDRLWSKVEN